MLISLDHWGREVICYPLQTTAQSAKAAKSPHSPSRWPTSRTAGVRSAPRPAPAWPHHHRPRFITTTTAAVCYADRGTRYCTHQSRNASSVSSVPLATTLLCRLPRRHNHSARPLMLASKARLQCTQRASQRLYQPRSSPSLPGTSTHRTHATSAHESTVYPVRQHSPQVHSRHPAHLPRDQVRRFMLVQATREIFWCFAILCDV